MPAHIHGCTHMHMHTHTHTHVHIHTYTCKFCPSVSSLQEHLCAPGTVNMHCFAWIFYMPYLYIFIHSINHAHTSHTDTHIHTHAHTHTHTHTHSLLTGCFFVGTDEVSSQPSPSAGPKLPILHQLSSCPRQHFLHEWAEPQHRCSNHKPVYCLSITRRAREPPVPGGEATQRTKDRDGRGSKQRKGDSALYAGGTPWSQSQCHWTWWKHWGWWVLEVGLHVTRVFFVVFFKAVWWSCAEFHPNLTFMVDWALKSS